MEPDSLMMEHKAYNLNLSADDGLRTKARKDRGKENIPPSDGLNAPVRFSTTISAAQDMMPNNRLPLALLDATDYNAPDCDVDSHSIVPHSRYLEVGNV